MRSTENAGISCSPQCVDIYILLSPDDQRPPSRFLAHTGARYEILDLREIYGAETRNSACSSRGCPSCGGLQSVSSWRRVRRTRAPRRFSGNPRHSFSGAGSSQNGTFSGGGIGRKIRAGRSTINYFRFGGNRVRVRESVCTE